MCRTLHSVPSSPCTVTSHKSQVIVSNNGSHVLCEHQAKSFKTQLRGQRMSQWADRSKRTSASHTSDCSLKMLAHVILFCSCCHVPSPFVDTFLLVVCVLGLIFFVLSEPEHIGMIGSKSRSHVPPTKFLTFPLERVAGVVVGCWCGRPRVPRPPWPWYPWQWSYWELVVGGAPFVKS